MGTDNNAMPARLWFIGPVLCSCSSPANAEQPDESGTRNGPRSHVLLVRMIQRDVRTLAREYKQNKARPVSYYDVPARREVREHGSCLTPPSLKQHETSCELAALKGSEVQFYLAHVTFCPAPPLPFSDPKKYTERKSTKNLGFLDSAASDTCKRCQRDPGKFSALDFADSQMIELRLPRTPARPRVISTQHTKLIRATCSSGDRGNRVVLMTRSG
jgi:hypothetical protein